MHGEVAVNRERRRLDLSTRKDWNTYSKRIPERIGEVEEKEDMDEKLKSITALMTAEVCPVKVVRREVGPWMTAEIQELRRRRNRTRRNMAKMRSEGLEIYRELKEKTIIAKRETWRTQMDRIESERNVKRAWSVVRQLRGQGSREHGASDLCCIGANGERTRKPKQTPSSRNYHREIDEEDKKRVYVASHLRKWTYHLQRRIRGGRCSKWRRGGDTLPRGAAALQLVRSCRECVCSSYAAEMVAMDRAVSWLADGEEQWNTSVVITNSRSLLDGLRGSSRDLRGLRERLWDLQRHQKTVTLLWVSGHCGLTGNKEAGRLTGLGAALEQANTPIISCKEKLEERQCDMRG